MNRKPSTKINSYKFTPSELLDVRRICRDFTFLEFYLEYFQDHYYRPFFIRINNKRVGIMVLSRHSFVLYGDFLWVDQDYRDQGLETELLQYAEQIM